MSMQFPGARNAGDSLIVQAPAKVNLHLEVLGKRADGYHELETLMATVDLFDTLEFRALPSGTELACNEASLSVGDDNLVKRAVELVRRETGIDSGISIVLTKRIPHAAGMAGGSSDAAAALLGLDRWWNLGWSRERLQELGARLGSDVSFFFHAPAAICRGRGERVTAVRPGTVLHLVAIKPPEGLGTAAVFRNLKPPRDLMDVRPIASALERGNVQEIASLLFNRLEESSFALSPRVAALRRRLGETDALGTLMSGSGSTVYAVCSGPDAARRLGASLEAENLGAVFVVATSL